MTLAQVIERMPQSVQQERLSLMIRMLSCTTALTIVFTATGVLAEVTPEEVWEGWQALSTVAGQELSVGGTSRNGDTLEVSDLVITQTDELGGSFSASIDKMNFKDNGDGTVLVTMSDSYPLSLTFPAESDGPSSLKLTVSQPGLMVTAGGSAAETSYDFAAPTVSVKLDEVKDKDGKVNDTQADLVMTEMAASYLVSREGEATELDSKFTAKGVTLNVAGKGIEGSGEGTVTVSMTDLAGTTKGNFLAAEMMANMALALKSGFTTDSSFSFGAVAMNVDINEPEGPLKLAASATGGDLVLAIDKDRLNYGTALKAASFTVSGPDIPFPEVVVSFAETAFNLLMPVSKSDAPQDFALTTKLIDFTISEDVWGLFDPTVTLPRDPATLVVDLKGTGFWKQDIMDPAVQMEGVEPPGELTSLDLTQILVKAAGAEVGATGGLTFDNTDLITFDGVPAPTGTINVTIKGVNALIDNLIAIGILPDDQATGARMMLGLFARPGPGPDELTSVIEFKEGGLFANGQQLQ
ncbi:MAG: hypothetical protein C0524_01905 [Rhodobacter sp.]|nr:hypothetical protein [Rhodobacter sp.]